LRLWIDVMTPKQARVFSKVYREASSRGHEVLVTAREHGETHEILRMEGVPHRALGRHGGGELASKLKAYAERALLLADAVSEFEPGALISLSSPEAVRVAFGLGIPAISMNDTPHSTFVGRLTLPLSDRLVYPAAIPAHLWLRLGVNERSLRPYYGVDELAWVMDAISSWTPKSKVSRLAVVRPEESQASYLLREGKGESVVEPCIRVLLDEGYRVLLLPRYESQRHYFAEKYQESIEMPPQALDSLSLYLEADVVISGGGTMSREAALLGTPGISLFPLDVPLHVDEFVSSIGLPLWRFRDPELGARFLRSLLRDPLAYRVDPRPALNMLENPVQVVLSEAEALSKANS